MKHLKVRVVLEIITVLLCMSIFSPMVVVGNAYDKSGVTEDILNGIISSLGSGDASGNSGDIKLPSLPGNSEGNNSNNNNDNTNSPSSVSTVPSSKVTGLKIVSTTVDSISFSWTKASDANWYVISYWPTGSASSAAVLMNVGDVNQYTLTNLSQNEYVIYVMPARKLDNGEVKYSTILNYTSVRCCPTAKKPTGFSLSNIGVGYCSFAISGLGNSDTSFYDSEVILYDYSGKKLGTYYGEPTGISITDTRIKKNRFYSAKVRGYYELADGTRIAGQWSKIKYFATSLKKVSGNAKGKKISLNWSKVSGAKKYEIYVRSSSASNYKKVKTTKHTSCTISKYGKKSFKKGTTYYIKVIASMKKSNTTYKCKSDVYRVRIPK